MKKIFLLSIFLFFNFNKNVFSFENGGFCFHTSLYGGNCYDSKMTILNAEEGERILFKKQNYNIKKHIIFLNVSVLNFGYFYSTQYSIGKNTPDIFGFNAKIVEGERSDIYKGLESGDDKYKSKAFNFEFQVGIDYSFYLSKYFKPLIGFYFSFSPFLGSNAYQHIFSTTDELGLKNTNVDFDFLLQFGVKFGNVIEIKEKHLIIPYLTAGYSYRSANINAYYKVEPYEEKVCTGSGKHHKSCHYVEKDYKEEKIDSALEHFIFCGGGIDYQYTIFRVGMYAKVHFPLNNLLLKDIDGSMVNFGNRVIMSVGASLGFSLPIVF